MVAREVEHARLVLAADERRVPVKTVTFLAFRGFRAQIALFAGAKIDPVNETFLAFGVENVAIGRIENDIKSVAALERRPIGIANTFFARHLARPDKTLSCPVIRRQSGKTAASRRAKCGKIRRPEND